MAAAPRRQPLGRPARDHRAADLPPPRRLRTASAVAATARPESGDPGNLDDESFRPQIAFAVEDGGECQMRKDSEGDRRLLS